MVKAKSFIGGMLLVAAGAGMGWSARALVFPGLDQGDGPGGEEGGSLPETAPAQMLVRVTTVEVSQGDLALVLVAAGVVKAAPAAERVLSSRASGRVLEIFATGGQKVERGEVLLRFEVAPLEAVLMQARATLALAENQLAEFEHAGRERQSVEFQTAAGRAKSARHLADAQLARLEALHADGLASDKAMAEAKQNAEEGRADQELAELASSAFQSTGSNLQLATLVAARTSADASMREAERVLAEAELRAPADGQITEFSAHAGEKLEAGARVGRLLVSEGRVVSFSVPASAAGQLSIGATATWNDAAGALRSGKLVRLGGEVDSSSGLLEALVAPDPETPAAPPGLNVRGELELQRLKNVMLVPERAVMRAHDAQGVVLATAEGTARVANVKLLGRHAGLAGIEGDVHPGDRVIVDGGYNLPDGAHIVDAGAAADAHENGKHAGPEFEHAQPAEDGK